MDRTKFQCECVGFDFSVSIHELARFYRVTIGTIIVGNCTGNTWVKTPKYHMWESGWSSMEFSCIQWGVMDSVEHIVESTGVQ